MPLLYALEQIRTPLMDSFLYLITQFGDETLFILLGLMVFWCIDKDEGYYLLSIGLIGTALNQMLKLIMRIPRPWILDPKFTIVEKARAGASGYSFPSGHTQMSVGIYGGIAHWTKNKTARALCIVLCLLVPFSRMYLGVHTPWDVGVSVALALMMIFALRPVILHGKDHPNTMRILLAGMALFSILYLLFVRLYPFPADVDFENLAHGTKNAHSILGFSVGLWLTWEWDRRVIHFQTKASLSIQLIKLIFGVALLFAVKSLLKAPLNSLMHGSYFADGIRYFLMMIFAGCVWPLTFPWLTKKFSR